MPDATDAFWAKMQRKAAALAPDLQRDFLRGLEALRQRMDAPDIRRMMQAGDLERAVMIALSDEEVAVAFSRFRARSQVTVQRAVADFGKDIPGVPPHVGIAFNVLNPQVIAAVQAMDTVMMRGLAEGMRDAVRQAIRAGLEAGVNPRETARGLREILGLSPHQEEAIRNFEAMLRGGPQAAVYKSALNAELRDKRFDATLRRAIAGREKLTDAQVERMVTAYRRKMVAFNAETQARTATLDALKLGQQLSWQEAMDKGFVPRGQLFKQWKGVMDDREREEHKAMERETVPFEQPYSNGEMVPGESTYNCRCVSIIFTQAA